MRRAGTLGGCWYWISWTVGNYDLVTWVNKVGNFKSFLTFVLENEKQSIHHFNVIVVKSTKNGLFILFIQSDFTRTISNFVLLRHSNQFNDAQD